MEAIAFLPELWKNTCKYFGMVHLGVLDVSFQNQMDRRRWIRGGGGVWKWNIAIYMAKLVIYIAI